MYERIFTNIDAPPNSYLRRTVLASCIIWTSATWPFWCSIQGAWISHQGGQSFLLDIAHNQAASSVSYLVANCTKGTRNHGATFALSESAHPATKSEELNSICLRLFAFSQTRPKNVTPPFYTKKRRKHNKSWIQRFIDLFASHILHTSTWPSHTATRCILRYRSSCTPSITTLTCLFVRHYFHCVLVAQHENKKKSDFSAALPPYHVPTDYILSYL